MNYKIEQGIQIGELIPNTYLARRYQNRYEISPVYVGDGTAFDAMAEAQKVGLYSVTAYDTTYICIGGNWYAFGFAKEPK